MAFSVAPSASWKQLLLNALQSNSKVKHSLSFQLATVGSNGKPANRTVVFRGFQEGSERIQINTDLRSTKVEDFKHCPYGEICWYFTETQEQFRINGKVNIIDGSDSDPSKHQLREKAWFDCTLQSRLRYLGDYPGRPYASEKPLEEGSLDVSVGPVDTFCVLLLDPEKVDYVNLMIDERLSFTSKQSNGEKCWTSEKINP